MLRSEPEGPIEHVVVLVSVGAPRRARFRGRRGRTVGEEAGPEPVSTMRVNVIGTDPLASADDGEAFVRAARAGEADDEVEAALGVVNGLVHLHRIASADPAIHEVSRAQAIAIRVGYGSGDELAEGSWRLAHELPAPRGARARRRSAAALRPRERLAAFLGRRDEPLICEELALRARLDLDHDRTRAAALGLRIALEVAIAELGAEQRPSADARERLEELEGLAPGIDELAVLAAEDDLDDDALETVAHALGRLEAALRARAARGPALDRE